MRKYGFWFHENDDSKSDYVGKCQSNWMQFSFAILRRKNQIKLNKYIHINGIVGKNLQL